MILSDSANETGDPVEIQLSQQQQQDDQKEEEEKKHAVSSNNVVSDKESEKEIVTPTAGPMIEIPMLHDNKILKVQVSWENFCKLPLQGIVDCTTNKNLIETKHTDVKETINSSFCMQISSTNGSEGGGVSSRQSCILPTQVGVDSSGEVRADFPFDGKVLSRREKQQLSTSTLAGSTSDEKTEDTSKSDTSADSVDKSHVFGVNAKKYLAKKVADLKRGQREGDGYMYCSLSEKALSHRDVPQVEKRYKIADNEIQSAASAVVMDGIYTQENYSSELFSSSSSGRVFHTDNSDVTGESGQDETLEIDVVGNSEESAPGDGSQTTHDYNNSVNTIPETPAHLVQYSLTDNSAIDGDESKNQIPVEESTKHDQVTSDESQQLVSDDVQQKESNSPPEEEVKQADKNTINDTHTPTKDEKPSDPQNDTEPEDQVIPKDEETLTEENQPSEAEVKVNDTEKEDADTNLVPDTQDNNNKEEADTNLVPDTHEQTEKPKKVQKRKGKKNFALRAKATASKTGDSGGTHTESVTFTVHSTMASVVDSISKGFSEYEKTVPKHFNFKIHPIVRMEQIDSVQMDGGDQSAKKRKVDNPEHDAGIMRSVSAEPDQKERKLKIYIDDDLALERLMIEEFKKPAPTKGKELSEYLFPYSTCK